MLDEARPLKTINMHYRLLVLNTTGTKSKERMWETETQDAVRKRDERVVKESCAAAEGGEAETEEREMNGDRDGGKRGG